MLFFGLVESTYTTNTEKLKSCHQQTTRRPSADTTNWDAVSKPKRNARSLTDTQTYENTAVLVLLAGGDLTANIHIIQ